MHVIQGDRIVYKEGDGGFLFPDPINYASSDSVEVVDLAVRWKEQFAVDLYKDFDSWHELLHRDQELEWLAGVVESAHQRGAKIHVSGITTQESIEYIRSYYEARGYFSDYPRKCHVPLVEALVTISVPINNLVFSSKDKRKLQWEISYPPVRSPSDQRMILTWLRTGVIIGLEVLPDQKKLVSQVCEDELLNPFEIGRLVRFNYEERAI